jgi:tRNA(adenine34) deaminase
MPEKFLQRAIELAQQAERQGEVPVGAVVTYKNKIIGEGFNQPIATHDPTAHAEIIAMRQAAQNLQNYRLTDCELYVTLEPCAMCAAAMIHARIHHCFFGAYDAKSSASIIFDSELSQKLNHRINISGGILEESCVKIIKNFFKKRR